MEQTQYSSFIQDAALERFFASNKQVLTSLLRKFFSITGKVLDIFVVGTERREATVIFVDARGKKTFVSVGQASNPENLPDINPAVLNMLVKLSDGKNLGIQLQVALNKEENPLRNIVTDWVSLHNYDPEQKKLKNPDEITPTYLLIFTNFTVFEEEQDYINELTLRFSKYPDRDVKSGFRIVIAELSKFNKGCFELENMQDRWLYILKHSADLTTEEVEHLSQDQETKMALEHLEKISKDGSLD